MKRRTEYLTDEELEMLVVECEKDPVRYPDELSEQLTERIRGSCLPGRRPKESYALYCVKVWLSVAAAVALLMFAPQLYRVPSREDVLCGSTVPSRQEVLDDPGPNWCYETVCMIKDRLIMIFDKTEELK